MANRYLQAYEFCYKFLRVYGVWLRKDVPKPLWFTGYSILMHVFMGLNNVALEIKWIQNSRNVREFASAGYIVSSCLMSQIKALMLWYNKRVLLKHLKLLELPHFAIRSQNEAEILEKELSYFRKSWYILLGLCGPAVLLVCLQPIFWVKNDGMPFPAWYPFNVTVSPFYGLMYAHQAISAVFLTSAYMLVDILLCGSLIFIGLQCLLLRERIKAIGEVGSKNKNILVDCLEHQRSIIRIVKSNDKLFGRIYFFQLISSTITLCLNLFLMSLTNPRTFEFTFLVVYQIAIGNMLLLPCWFATEMTRKSEGIADAIYNINWIEAENALKKDLSFFILLSQKPLKFYVIDFFEVSIVTFVTIYRAAMTYYAVLNNLNH